MSLFDIRHQGPAQQLLQRAVAGERVPHAYIFHGPSGVGKEGLAQAFARLLLCPQPRRVAGDLAPPEYAGRINEWHDSCGQCTSCRLVDAGTHPDCHRIHRQLNKYHEDAAVRARKGMDLSVDVIRQFVIAPAARKAGMGQRKVFLIIESERMSDSAQNSLLKTLEEPAPGTVLILLARAADALLPTIRSRCQKVAFNTLPAGFVAELIQRLRPQAAPQAVHFVAHHEPGSAGRALTWLDEGYFDSNDRLVEAIAGLERRTSTTFAGKLEELAKGKTKTKTVNPDVPEASETDVQRETLQSLISMIATIYRDVLHMACATGLPVCNQHRRPELQRLSRRLSPAACQEAIRTAAQAEFQLGLNANPRLCLDGLVIQLARLHAGERPVLI